MPCKSCFVEVVLKLYLMYHPDGCQLYEWWDGQLLKVLAIPCQANGVTGVVGLNPIEEAFLDGLLKPAAPLGISISDRFQVHKSLARELKLLPKPSSK